MAAADGDQVTDGNRDGLGAHDRRRLRVLNVVVGVVHLAQAVLMVVIGNDLSLPVTAGYLSDDPILVTKGVQPDVAFDVRIAPAVAVFLFLAAADHLLVAAPGIRDRYERQLARGMNLFRWAEYSLSASLMIVLIGLFVGVRDIGAVIGLFTANAAMILFGLLMEKHQRPGNADWSAFWFGCLAGIGPWVAVGWYVLGAAQVPGFVYAITGFQLVLFTAFALNQAFQYRQVAWWRSYLFGEVAYIVLSLTAKSLAGLDHLRQRAPRLSDGLTPPAPRPRR